MASVPFLLRFAKPIPEIFYHCLRYDPRRQVTQVLVDRDWVDALDTDTQIGKGTRQTAVAHETFDDK